MISVRSADVRGLSSSVVKTLQFYSGPESIVFEAQTDEVIREIKRQTLSLINLSTEYRLTIKKKTPGSVMRFDPVSTEIRVKFDADIPALLYIDNGEGLELVTFEFKVDGLTYTRVLERPIDNRGQVFRGDRRYLTVKKRNQSKKMKDKKKAKGMRVGKPN